MGNQGDWTWSKSSRKLMIQLYRERKDKFRDRAQKKKKLWEEICLEMEVAGYEGLDSEALDRKMRNLKKTYKNIKDNNSKTGRGRVAWEYFESFEDIFADDITMNVPSFISSLSSTAIASSEELFYNEEYLVDVTNESEITQDEVIPAKKKKANKAKESYKRDKILLEIETQRIVAIENLTAKIDESNNIQNERNSLLKEFLQKPS